MCAPPPPAHASCSQGALQIALPATERVVARGELEKARSQERGATARCATLVAEDCSRAPRTRGAGAQPAKTAAAAKVGRSPRAWRVAAQRAACLSGESCVRARRATEKRETNAEAVCRRPRQAHCARGNELDGVGTGGVLYGPRLLSCQLSAADCRVMSCNDFTTSRLARTQIEPPGSRNARLMPSLLPARRQGTDALRVAADS